MFDAKRHPKRLSVALPEKVAEELEAIAKLSDVPVASVIRECIRRALPGVREEAERERDGNEDQGRLTG